MYIGALLRSAARALTQRVIAPFVAARRYIIKLKNNYLNIMYRRVASVLHKGAPSSITLLVDQPA